MTIWLGIWTVGVPLFGVAQAADEPPAHPATTGPIIADSAVPIATGHFCLQPYWSLNLVGGRFSANWRRVGAGGNFTSLEIPVKLTYSPAPNTEVYVVANFLQNWAGQVEPPGPNGGRNASFTGLGDIYLTGKYQLLEETAWRPTVTALFTTVFPSGHHAPLNPGRLGTDALGNGAFSFTPGFNLSKWLGSVCLYANLWYSFSLRDPGVPANQQSGPLLFSVHGRDLITANLAAEWVLTPKWVALLECYSSWDTGPLFRHSRESLSTNVGVMPGIEYIFDPRWSAALGVAIDLAGKNSFYNYTPILTVLLSY